MAKERDFLEPALHRYCYSLEESEYWGLLQTIQKNWRSDLEGKYLMLAKDNKKLLRGKSYCLILPGSDGKGERHPQSKTEMILLLGRENPKLEREIIQKVRDINNEGFLGLMETKVVGGDEEMLSFFRRSRLSVYPDRVLNSCFLAGDNQLYFQARRQVLEEMTNKRIKEEMKEQLRQYKKAIETGEYRGLKVFSEERREQYYFESSNPKETRFGFKISFLRAVQRKLDLQTAQLAESKKEELDALAQNLPTSTVERIGYFSRRGFLDPNFAPKLQRAYLWFLKNYHCAQESFSDNKNHLAITPFDQGRFTIEKGVVMEFIGPERTFK